MGRLRAVGLALAGLGVVSACGGDGGGPSQSDLVGTWNMVKCEYVSTQGLGTVDLIAGGGTGTLVLTANDTLRMTVTPATGPAVVFVATYEISGIDLMRVTPVGVTWYWAFDMQLAGNNLSLTNGSAQYDFDHNGQPDDAKWNLQMTR